MSKKRLFSVALAVLVLALLLSVGGYHSVFSEGGHKKWTRWWTSYEEGEGALTVKGRDRDKPRMSMTDPDLELSYKDPRVKPLFQMVLYYYPVNYFDRYLRDNNRNARSLMAVLALTNNDHGILQELKKHQEDSDVLLTLASSFDLSNEEKLGYITKYIEQNPHEMQGYLLAAAISKELGLPSSQIEDLVKKGTDAERISLGRPYLVADMKEALMSSGLSNTESEIYLHAVQRPWSAQLSDSLKVITQSSIGRLEDVKNDPVAKADMVEYCAATIMSFKELAAMIDINSQLVTYVHYMNFFKAIQQDVEMPNGWGNSSAFEEELKQEFVELAALNRAFRKQMLQMSPDEVDQYFEDQASLGELAAKRKLLGLE